LFVGSDGSERFQEMLSGLKQAQEEPKVLENLQQIHRHVCFRDLDNLETQSLVEAICQVLQSESPIILATCLDILFALKISSLTFTIASKVFFHLACQDSNDQLLIKHKTIEKCTSVLAKSSPDVDRESLLYVYGAFKFLTYNPRVLDLACRNAFPSLVITQLRAMSTSLVNANFDYSNIVFQATSCLRNLLNCSDGKNSFANLEGDQLLLNLIRVYMSNVEIMCNLSRIYSALSMDSIIGKKMALTSRETIGSLFRMMETHAEKPDLVVRAAFAMGNFAATSDDVRENIFQSANSIQLMTKLLQKYSKDIFDNGSKEEKEVLEKKEDTVVKLIRVIANLSLTPNIGNSLAMNGQLIKALLVVLKDYLSSSKESPKSTHMLLPALSSVCNLSYYPVLYHQEVFRCTRGLLFHDDHEIATESARALGNLTRKKDIRVAMMSDFPWSQLYDQMQYLDSREFIFSSIGILVNMMTDSEFKPLFLEQNGLELCFYVLQDSPTEWPTKTLACQLLWNFFNDFPEAEWKIGREKFDEMANLIIALIELEEEEDGEQNAADNDRKEFLAVAMHLLNRVLMNEDNLDLGVTSVTKPR
jgi:hypothetical protein